jgi:RNA polymerase sigma factor (sigma-70 family)
MKIYTGFNVEIELTDEWYEFCIEQNRVIYNNDKKESRRHCSLEAYNVDDNFLASKENIEKEYTDAEAVRNILSKLNPKQQALVKAIFIEGVPKSEYAESIGVTPRAVTQQIETIRKKLKKFF